MSSAAATPFVFLLRPVFILTVLLGSSLLFLVQPLVARLALPILGGSPSVWNTAMLFYQSALLVGYAYAHALQRLPFRVQAILHLGLLLSAAVTLPIGLSATHMEPSGADTPLWLIGLLALSIGPLFVAVAAQAPLMQAWFARSADPAAASPFFLYAASNLGSLAGLLSYPFLLEPLTSLGFQRQLWSAGYLLLIALVGLGAMAVWRGGDRPPAALPDTSSARGARPVDWRRRLHWLLLSAVPSGLMLSTTTHLTTDIMAMPLLWVLPLGVYLLSFILVFSANGAAHARRASRMAPIALLIGGASGLASLGQAASLYGAGSLILLLVVSTSLHGALAADRPPPDRLTGFYLTMAAGGVVGGLFPALVAPNLFDWVYEHPILLLMAALLVPARPLTARIGELWRGNGLAARLLRIGTPPLTLVLGWILGATLNLQALPAWQIAMLVMLAGLGVLAIGRPIWYTWVLAMLMLALGGWQQIDVSTVEGARYRSFFGIYTIQNSQKTLTRRLLHGTTLHGAQSLDPARATEPLTYYAPGSGIGLALKALPGVVPGASVGVVGLGAGSLLCYSRPGQRWTAFEIDPLVVELATRAGAFTYVERCRPDVEIRLGDARLTVAREPMGSFDLLVIDAFSSDAIPLHLMTREAFETWTRALAPDGLLAVHISNRFLELEPVVAAIATGLGLHGMVVDFRPSEEERLGPTAYSASTWVLLSRDRQALDAAIAASDAPDAFRPIVADPAVTAWTDGFASIVPVLKPFWRGFI